jgi:hypothetical protein
VNGYQKAVNGYYTFATQRNAFMITDNETQVLEQEKLKLIEEFKQDQPDLYSLYLRILSSRNMDNPRSGEMAISEDNTNGKSQ